MSTRGKPQDFNLALRESACDDVACQLFSDVRTDPLGSGVHRADRVQEILSYKTLQYIRLCAALQGARGQCIASVSYKHHDARLRVFTPDRNNRVDAAHIGHLKIHERDVRLAGAELLDGFPPA